ncbi:unnamed protein product [Owenia fusiformis]|uniref:WD repeat-containing protein 63 n=1 Tax=Owenia fusiformis TaxID=6347 RepID=A0A8S4MXS5_OWEFU|nr:unnamed protein product [Owenia fusiformis]
MGDPDKAISDKEKQNATEEKEKDTSGSKPGSAKSKPGSATSKRSKSPANAKSPAPAKGKTSKAAGKKGGKKGGKKEEEKKPEPPPEEEKDENALPDNVAPFFMTSKTQEIFSCVADEHVTEEQPFKLIPKAEILEDLKMRAGVSDFSVIKQTIVDYPGEDILVVYDADFKHGQNYLIALTEEAKDKLLKGPEEEGAEGGEGGEAVEEEQIEYKYIPPESKPWISYGSEKEIAEEAVVETRKPISISVKRLRREFGAPVKFTDRNVADAKDGYIECTPYEDKTPDVKKVELTKSIQAVPQFIDQGCQTTWRHPRNAEVQYYPREFNEEELKVENENPKVGEFLKSVAPRFQLALQQNEIMDVFADDWNQLGDDDSGFGSKADNHLKEYQSFTDLQFSKDKTITCIDWHPTIKGIVAVSASEKISFDDRIDNAEKIIMTPSLILIWSFADPIHPQLLLEAPDDIYSFKFCNTDPNIIAGGCMNGQLVLWDISQHIDRLKAPRANARKKNNNTIPGFEDESAMDIPIVRYCAVSSIENSHKAAITDILWMPDHMELNRMGYAMENKLQQSVQIMTCATDYSVLVWDTRPPKGHQVQDEKGPMGVPNTFKHLDLVWKPHLRVFLSKAEPGGDHAPTKFTIQERQGDRSAVEDEAPGMEKKESSTVGGFQYGGKPSSAKQNKLLKSVQTKFYVGTEDGEIVYVDWMPQKDQDTGKINTPKPEFYHQAHDGPIVTLQRSPFFKDVLLCIGGWTFSLWKEGVISGPILQSNPSSKRLTGGYWSPSRPGVFYITRVDGSIDVWDILDRTHEPSLNQNVSAHPITCIYPYHITNKQHLLAVGDNSGTLHIMEIPWSLRVPTPNELQGVTNYFDREVKRRAFVVARWDFREREKMEIEAESKRRAGIAPNVQLTEDEIVYRMKQEYNAYLDEEASFLRDLGLKQEEDEPLPEV